MVYIVILQHKKAKFVMEMTSSAKRPRKGFFAAGVERAVYI